MAGQTNSGELGASYAIIDAILRKLIDNGDAIDEIAATLDIDRDTVEHVATMHWGSAHKRRLPPTPDPSHR